MRKLFALVSVCLVVIAAVAAFAVLSVPEPRVFPRPQTGIFYYAWSGALASDWLAPKYVDFPAFGLGNYSGQNKTVIAKELVLMEDLGVDFVVVSWWGSGVVEGDYGSKVDAAVKAVFETARESGVDLKFAIMVEGYLNGSSYDYAEIYDYVYDEFVVPYPGLYYEVDGKPLVCFFIDPSKVPRLVLNGSVPADSRFTTVLVGDQDYDQWTYNDIGRWNSSSYEPHANEISVSPRFDPYDDSTGRVPERAVDVNLTLGVYDAMWQRAIQLWKEGKIDTIMITSWNEYVERTMIEQHYDGTASVPPDFLYNKTRDYIRQLSEMNVQIHGEDYNDLTLSHLSDFGVSWVRMDYQFNLTEGMMTALHDAGYKVLAIIDSRTAGNSATIEEWNSTLLRIAADPVSQFVDAWEIWNEPNALPEFGGAYIAPSDYREMLRCAHAVLKNSTKGLIISGGLAPHANYLSYLHETFEGSDIGNDYDYFGLHLYNETVQVNLDCVDDAKVVTGKKVWITEMGRPSRNDSYTEENQAAYLIENIAGITPEVKRIFIYELYDRAGPSGDKEDFFGLLTKEYEKKAAYSKLKEMRLPEGAALEPWFKNALVAIVIISVGALAVLLILQAYRSRRSRAG